MPERAISILVGVSLLLFLLFRARKRRNGDDMTGHDGAKQRVRVAFMGNSILYYNDCPRLLEAISGGAIIQNSCLRGGASLVSLFKDGNGMGEKFASPNALKDDGSFDVGADTVEELLTDPAGWDFAVLNDYTQAPARPALRSQSLETLQGHYVPLLARSGARPVLLQTAAYRRDVNGAEDLGGVERFTALLAEGYQAYAAALCKALPGLPAQVAPVGDAFLVVKHERPELWLNLFQDDNFHPSPHGSYLQACLLYCCIFGRPSPEEIAVPDDPDTLWARARYMQPSKLRPPLLPLHSELKYLHGLATRVALSTPTGVPGAASRSRF